MYIDLFFIFAYVDRVITLKIGDPNVCPKLIQTSDQSIPQKEFDIECCPDYIYQNRKCEACPPGKFSRDCSVSCSHNYYGVQCKKMCNCTGNMKCDPIHGCVCFEGFTGKNCLNVCPPGRYGVNCNEECFCAQDAKCDSVTGVCVCPVGWFRDHCTKKCPFGKFGKDCNRSCDCSDDMKCDVITGDCNEKADPNSDGNIKESNGTVMIYIIMAAAIIGLVCVVTMILKAKEALCRKVQKPKKDTTKPKIKRQKAKRRGSSTQRDNAQTISFIMETEVSTLQPPLDEDLYCEIEDINVTEPGRY